MNDMEVLARQRLALLEQKEGIDAAIAAIDEQIIDAIEVGGAVDVAGQTVFRVQQRRTFDLAAARDTLPSALIDAATVPTLDPKRLQELLPPALRDTLMKPGRAFVARAKP